MKTIKTNAVPCSLDHINDVIDDVEYTQRTYNYITNLANQVHMIHVSIGWWHDSNGQPLDRNVGELIALTHSEVSEWMEGERKDLMDDKLPHRKMAEVEIADAIIRMLDFAGAAGYDVGGAIAEKLKFNLHREDHKRENREAEGGKQF